MISRLHTTRFLSFRDAAMYKEITKNVSEKVMSEKKKNVEIKYVYISMSEKVISTKLTLRVEIPALISPMRKETLGKKYISMFVYCIGLTPFIVGFDINYMLSNIYQTS